MRASAILNLGRLFDQLTNAVEKYGMGRRFSRALAPLIIVSACTLSITGCKDTGGKVEGSVTSGILDSANGDASASWSFLNSSDYTFDSNYVQVSGNKASLKTVNTTFDSASTFNSGTHVGTVYSGGTLGIISPSTQYSVNDILPDHESNLVGYWRMNNDWTDSSGNGHDGTLSGSASFSSPGFQGSHNAVIPSAGANRIYVGTSTDLTPSNITLSFWVKRTSSWASAYDNIFFAKSTWNGSDGFYMNLENSGGKSLLVFFNGTNSTQVNVSPDNLFALNDWSHVAMTFNSTTHAVAIYVNGVSQPLSSSVIPGAVINPSTVNKFIHFRDNIDEMAMWNVDLSAADVRKLYQMQKLNFTELSSSWAPHWPNLVGYWKMDGNWLDSSTSNLGAGTASNMSFSTSAKVGSQSGVFNGTSGYVQIASQSSLQFTDYGSVCTWIYPTDISTDFQGIVERRTSNVGASMVLNLRANYIEFGNYNGTDWSNIVDGTPTMVANSWQHVCATYAKNGYAKIYVNGVLNASKTVTGSMYAPALNWRLGLGAAMGKYFTGRLDEMGIWNMELSASDIALIYNRQKQKYAGSYDSPVIDMGASGATWTSLSSTSPLPFYKELPGSSDSESSSNYSSVGGSLMNGLVGLWHLDESSGTSGTSSIKDSSGNSYHGTPSGTYTLGASGVLGTSWFGGGGNFSVTTTDFNFPGTTAFSFSFYLKTTFKTAGQYFNVLGARSSNGSGNQGWLVYISGNSGKMIFTRTLNSSEKQVISPAAISDGIWHHYTGTFDGNQLKLYQDGTLTATTSDTTSLIFVATALTIFNGNGSGSYIDEVAIWNRALSASEALELYRRGANRVKYQVRSCASSDCSDASFIGPDGTGTTYFSELQNNTSVDSSGNPTGSVNTSRMSLDWSASGPLSNISGKPSNNRYFQYRVYMESDDENSLCSSSPCMPEVSSITVGPTGRYYGASPTVVNNTAVSYSTLKTMTRSDSGSCSTYQISTDGGSSWKWWNGSAWASTSGGVSTSNYLSDFTASRLESLGGGSYKFKAFLNTNTSGDFTQSCDLSSVNILYKK